ncbi:Protein of unknown function, partial [Saccharopolyspora kobensis]
PAVIAAIMSYEHLRVVAEFAGEGWRAGLLPLSVDGLVIASSVAALAARQAGQRVHGMTAVNLLVGLLVSVAANILVPFLPFLTSSGRIALSACVAAWPAVALALAFEELLRLRRAQVEVPQEAEVPEVPGLMDDVDYIQAALLPEPEVTGSQARAEVPEVPQEAEVPHVTAPEPELIELPEVTEPEATELPVAEPVTPFTGSVRDLAIAEVLRNPGITGKALGEMFPRAGRPRSDSWGRQIKRAVAANE